MLMVSTRVYQFRSFAQRLRVIPCNIVPGCRCWRSFTVAPAQGTCTGEERAAFNFCICWTAEPARNMREKNINNRTEPNLPGYDTIRFGCRVAWPGVAENNRKICIADEHDSLSERGRRQSAAPRPTGPHGLVVLAISDTTQRARRATAFVTRTCASLPLQLGVFLFLFELRFLCREPQPHLGNCLRGLRQLRPQLFNSALKPCFVLFEPGYEVSCFCLVACQCRVHLEQLMQRRRPKSGLHVRRGPTSLPDAVERSLTFSF